MTQWATQLIPAGSVVVGGLVTGSLTLWGQVLVNKGTHKREREARHDAFKVRQREIERDALLALQDALNEHFRLRVKLRIAPTPRPADLRDRFYELHTMIVALSTRVPSDVSVAAGQYLRLAASLSEEQSEEQKEEMRDFLVKAQSLAGQALMRDL